MTQQCLRVALSVVLITAVYATSVRAEPVGQVVVLHGLGRTSESMSRLADRLADAGYDVHNLDYPSTEATVDQLLTLLDGKIAECCLNTETPLHFVTHSLGGILVRAYLAEHRPEHLGRTVMLSPPNQGSELVDSLRQNPLFRWALGPVGSALGTDTNSLPKRLGTADYDLGIITGSRSLNPLASWLVTGDDDGKVSVDSAQLTGMAAFLVVPHSHTFIMDSRQVAEEVLHFLEHGAFSEQAAEPR